MLLFRFVSPIIANFYQEERDDQDNSVALPISVLKGVSQKIVHNQEIPL